MAYASRAGRARANPRNPQAQAVCDRCGIWHNHADLTFQFDWAGTSLINKQILVCSRCYDTPQEQLRAIIIPADPVPVRNPRPEYLAENEFSMALTYANFVDPTTGITETSGIVMTTLTGDIMVAQTTGEPPEGYNLTPGTDPYVPSSIGGTPGVPYGFDDVPNTGTLIVNGRIIQEP